MNFVTIRDGKWEVTLHGADDTPYRFDLRDKEGLRTFFENHQLTNVMCSSSVYHPSDGGAPKGFGPKTADRILQYACNWALPKIEALKSKARKVIGGKATPEEAREVAEALLRALEAE